MTKQRDKELKKAKRAFQMMEAMHSAKLTYLFLLEMEHEGKARRKALRMARKRKTSYIQ